MRSKNPKIIHRIYFSNFKPFYDPYEHYLETWHEQMPDYQIMQWNIDNLDVFENEWTRRAFEAAQPVFLSEYFRWKVLSEHGGLYLDADCEILNGKILHKLIEDLYENDAYDVFFGVEERANGNPTAQTFAAKVGAPQVTFMRDLYERRLGPLWHWRERRGLIGPQLLSLYFLDQGVRVADEGFFRNLDEPTIAARSKVYPQSYFSPKFSILGETLDYEEDKTCIYHMFANSNIDFAESPLREEARNKVLRFHEYRAALERANAFPRIFDAARFTPDAAQRSGDLIVAKDPQGVIFYGPYISLSPGDYEARIKIDTHPSRGKGEIKVTAVSGAKTFATMKIDFSKHRGPLIVPFTVPAGFERDIEITLAANAHGLLEFSGVTLNQQNADNAVMAPRSSRRLKILHRIYFGFDGKPDGFLPYLQTWQEQLPDFEIMHWNASNLPMDLNPYVRDMYQQRDHAFLTDFFRWYVLREHGGTYLDADVEVVNGSIYRGLVEELEQAPNLEAFIGVDDLKGGWYTAHSMASKPGSDISRFMCDVYANMGKFSVWRKKGMYFWAPQMTALYFANRGFNREGMGAAPYLRSPMVVAGVKIYPQDWFAPLAPTDNKAMPFVLNGLSRNTCLCHHFACSWHDSKSAHLAYALRSGGQSKVMLDDIINRQIEYNYTVADGNFQTQVGKLTNFGISTNGVAGRLAYGPYVEFGRGRYRATFLFADLSRSDGAAVDITCDAGDRILATAAVPDRRGQASVTVEFKLNERVSNVEFRTTVGRRSKLIFTGTVVEKLADEDRN